MPVRLRHPVTRVAQGGSLWNNGQTLVVLADGSMWAWGTNQFGQLGAGHRGRQPRPRRFLAPGGVTYRWLATGSATSYAISATGRVYAWGAGHLGQAGTGSVRATRTPVLVARGATSISATANDVLIATTG